MITFNCNFTCWECPDDCKMKTIMQILPEPIFNHKIIEIMKANAGFRQSLGAYTPKQAHDFVVKTSVAIGIARKKYLETLQK